jgi:DMSO/TMAO reductase YedYZ heme-binding membrane subunit
MQAVMFAYALFAGMVVLILLTIAIVAGISVVVRKLRSPQGRPKPPAQS